MHLHVACILLQVEEFLLRVELLINPGGGKFHSRFLLRPQMNLWSRERAIEWISVHVYAWICVNASMHDFCGHANRRTTIGLAVTWVTMVSGMIGVRAAIRA